MIQWMTELSHEWPLFTFFWLPLILMVLSKVNSLNWIWLLLYCYWIFESNSMFPFLFCMIAASWILGTIKSLIPQ